MPLHRKVPSLNRDRIVDHLRQILGAPLNQDGSDPFHWFAELSKPDGDPLLIWNLGGAADSTLWPVAVKRAIPLLPSSQSELLIPTHAKRAEPPKVYVVSDRSTAILQGLYSRLAGASATNIGRFGEWPAYFEFDVSGWQQYTLIPKETAERLANTWKAPTGHVIADPNIHATVTGAQTPDGPILMVYLHLDHEIAWEKVISKLPTRIDVLVSTRRGTDYRSLIPKAGEEATLWRTISQSPKTLFPAIWCCDTEVFEPPNNWYVARNGGNYGAPGVAMPPRSGT